MLSNEEKRKYIRQIMFGGVGLKGQEKLKNARVAIVGCGGLGCPALLYLASSGVGTIGVIDFDTVNITNIHRQILFGHSDVGLKKVESAKIKIQALHPGVHLELHDVMLNSENASGILKGYDVVIDGCDNFATRYIVNDSCVALGLPLVYASILNFEGQLAVFNYKGSKNLRDIFPEPPSPDEVPDCSENGVLATVPGILGLHMANECIKVILDKNVPANKLHIIDCLNNTISALEF